MLTESIIAGHGSGKGILRLKTGLIVINTMVVPKYNKTEFEKQSTEHTLRFLFNAIPEPMFIMDCQGVVLEANESFATRFGKSLSECLGIIVYDLLSPDVALHRRKKVAEVLLTPNLSDQA